MAPDDKPRLRGHRLVRLWVSVAQCQCGREFRIPEEDARGRSSANLRDELMDQHSSHLAAVRQRGGGGS